jgi:ATP-binding cassette, subfamily B, bacterial
VTQPRGFFQRLATVVRRLRPAIRRHRGVLIKGTLGTLLVVACRLAFPWPLRGVLEVAFDQPGGTVAGLVPSTGDPMLWLGLAFVVIVALQGLGELVQRLNFARFAIGVVHDIRAEAIAGVTRRRKAGDAIARVIGDSARFKSGLKGVLVRGTQNGTFFLGVCVMLFVIDVRMGAVFFVGGAIIAVVSGVGAARVARISRRLRRKEGELAQRIHKAVKKDDMSRLGDVSAAEQMTIQAEAKTTRLEGLTMLVVHVLLALTTCAVLAVGLQAVNAGDLSPADLFTVLFYLILVHNPTVRLGRQAVRVARVLASAERLIKLADQPPRAEPVEAPDALFDEREALERA